MSEFPLPLSLSFDTTARDRVIAMQIANARVARAASGGWRGVASALVVWLLIGLAIGWSGLPENFRAWALLLLLLAWPASHFARLAALRRVAMRLPARQTVRLSDAGLEVEVDGIRSHFDLARLSAIEVRSDALLIFLDPLQLVRVPRHAVAAEPLGAFTAALRERVPAQAAVPTPLHGGDSRSLHGLIGDLLSNLRAGLGFAFWRPAAVLRVRGSLAQVLLLFALGVLIGLGLDLWRVGPDGNFAWWAVPQSWQWMPCLLLGAWCAAQASREPQRFMAAGAALLSLNLWLSTLAGALYVRYPDGINWLGDYDLLVLWLPFVWFAFASVGSLWRVCATPREERVGVLLAVVCLVLAPILVFPQTPRLWNERIDEEAQREEWERRNQAAHEGVIYAQPGLLEEALASVQPGRPGVRDVFLLALAGHGSQDVFMREAESVQELFDERFDTAGRSVALINNPATAMSLPIASVTALERSLRTLGARMNAEDVLFLFMTSHGSPEFVFDLELQPYRFDALTPDRLKSMLDAAGIRQRVVVVSACYSGGFVEPLAGPETLVITAARADRNSHGCSHEADWTFFGRAYFDEALRHTRSFEQAFAMAKEAVARREKEEGYEASEPQIAMGERIRPVLAEIERRLEGK